MNGTLSAACSWSKCRSEYPRIVLLCDAMPRAGSSSSPVQRQVHSRRGAASLRHAAARGSDCDRARDGRRGRHGGLRRPRRPVPSLHPGRPRLWCGSLHLQKPECKGAMVLPCESFCCPGCWPAAFLLCIYSVLQSAPARLGSERSPLQCSGPVVVRPMTTAPGGNAAAVVGGSKMLSKDINTLPLPCRLSAKRTCRILT